MNYISGKMRNAKKYNKVSLLLYLAEINENVKVINNNS